MRYLLFGVMVILGAASCNKDKYTTTPQIKFKSITPSFLQNTVGLPTDGPKLTIEVTDQEGDFGIKENKDTSWVYIKNLSISPYKLDSFLFPKAVTGIVKKNLKADVEIALGGDGTPGHGVLASTNQAHHTDTLYFEVYVKDLEKNKSNVIKTDDPLLYINP